MAVKREHDFEIRRNFQSLHQHDLNEVPSPQVNHFHAMRGHWFFQISWVPFTQSTAWPSEALLNLVITCNSYLFCVFQAPQCFAVPGWRSAGARSFGLFHRLHVLHRYSDTLILLHYSLLLFLRGLRDRMRISSENNGAYGRPGASFEPVGAVHHQQVANGRRSTRTLELLSDSVIERRRNAPTWRMDSEKLNAT